MAGNAAGTAKTRNTVLLCGAAGNFMLQAATCLGAAGYAVEVLTPTRMPALARSRWVRKTHYTPWSALVDDPARFALALDRAIARSDASPRCRRPA